MNGFYTQKNSQQKTRITSATLVIDLFWFVYNVCVTILLEMLWTIHLMTSYITPSKTGLEKSSSNLLWRVQHDVDFLSQREFTISAFHSTSTDTSENNNVCIISRENLSGLALP